MASNILKSFPNLGMRSKRQEGAWWSDQFTSCYQSLVFLFFLTGWVLLQAWPDIKIDVCYLDKLEASVEEGGLQQSLNAGDPHPIGRRRGEGDGGVHWWPGYGWGRRGRKRGWEELVQVTLLRFLRHRSEGEIILNTFDILDLTSLPCLCSCVIIISHYWWVNFTVWYDLRAVRHRHCFHSHLLKGEVFLCSS